MWLPLRSQAHPGCDMIIYIAWPVFASLGLETKEFFKCGKAVLEQFIGIIQQLFKLLVANLSC